MGEINVKILGYLMTDRNWKNIRDIGLHVGTEQNPDRLKYQLDDLVKRQIIDYWENIPDSEKKKIMQHEEIKGKNNYRITDKGREKFEKIRNDCLDEDTKTILRMQRAGTEN